MDIEINILAVAILVVIIAIVYAVTDMAIKKVRKRFSAIEKKPKKRPVGFK